MRFAFLLPLARFLERTPATATTTTTRVFLNLTSAVPALRSTPVPFWFWYLLPFIPPCAVLIHLPGFQLPVGFCALCHTVGFAVLRVSFRSHGFALCCQNAACRVRTFFSPCYLLPPPYLTGRNDPTHHSTADITASGSPLTTTGRTFLVFAPTCYAALPLYLSTGRRLHFALHEHYR